MKKDLYNNINCDRAISPVNVTDTTAQTGQIIDRQGFESLTFVIATGSLADADATFTLLVEDGDESDLSDAANVADEFLLGTETGSDFQFDDDNEVRWIGYKGNKRYVRVTITPVNNTGNAYFSVVAVKGSPLSGPTTQDS